METKYYTPTISEFYVGFEYEIEDLHDNLKDRAWRHVIADWCELDQAYDDWEHDYNNFKYNYRVKYLDKEDIESFGFKPYQSYRALRYGECTEYVLNREYDSYSLTHFNDYNFNQVLIKSQPPKFGMLGVNILFDGEIKNKSELIKVLKQIGFYGTEDNK